MEYKNQTPSNFMMFQNETENYSMNSVDHYYPLPLKSLPVWEVALKITIYSILILTALIGNILVILVVCRNKRMQTTTNYFIVNLAVSDLLVTISCSWVTLVDNITDGWVLGSFFCKFNSFAQVVSFISSILSLALVACDRFFGIVYAMKAHIIERKAKPSLIIIWIFSICIGSPLLFMRKVYVRHWKNHDERWCDDAEWLLVEKDYDMEVGVIYHRPGRTAYWTAISLILFTLPIVAMVGAYCGIIKTLWSTKPPGERVTKDITVQTKMKRKVVCMLMLILAVFGICWLPLQVSILYSEYRSEKHKLMGEWYDLFTFAANLLAFTNSALNPLIYAGFNENFRKGIVTLFTCYKKRRWTAMARIDSFRSNTITMSTKI